MRNRTWGNTGSSGEGQSAQGEAFGLALNRVDSATAMVTVNQQVIIADRRPILATPKTSSSVRDLPMPDFVQEAIAEHAERLKLGENDVLCRTAKGTLFRRDYYNRYIWKPAIQAAGLMADTTFLDLRHYLRQHGPGRGRADLGGVPLARAQVHHHDRRPVREHLVPEASARARNALDGAFAAARARAAEAPRPGACAPAVHRVLDRGNKPQARGTRRGEPACRPGSVPRVSARRRSSI
jgi:hypothetical protein